MKPSTELHDLIKSLSKSEKRYFKLISSLQSGDKNYIRLFDYLEQQEVYDEEAVKNEFKKEIFIRHLPSEKNHLYSLILKSLRNFHADKSAASQLQEQLRNIELLYNKALYKECNKIIRKAKKLAYDYEKFYYLLDIINWEKMLVEEEYQHGVFEKDMIKLVEEESVCLEKLRNLAEYQILYSKINYAFRKGGFARNKEEQKMVDEIANHYLIKGKNTAQSKKAATACYFIKGLCALTERNFSECEIHFKKVISILETNPPIMEELPKRYLRALSNLLTVYLNTGKYEKYIETLNVIKSLKEHAMFSSTDVQVKLTTSACIAELVLYQTISDMEKGQRVVDEIIKNIDSFKDKINKEEEVTFYYQIAQFYFMCADYKKALFWINKILNDNEGDLRQDIFIFSRLFNLIIHYELGNYDLLDYIIKSTSRFVKKKQKFYKFEDAFLQGMKQFIKPKKSASAQEIFTSMKKQIDKVLEDSFEQAALEYFDFSSWLESKIQHLSFAEVQRRKLKGLHISFESDYSINR